MQLIEKCREILLEKRGENFQRGRECLEKKLAGMNTSSAQQHAYIEATDKTVRKGIFLITSAQI
jgi:hypothetical protein